MSGHSYQEYRLVGVIWRDSHCQQGWRDMEDVDTQIKPIVTVGFLTHETETTITISNCIGGWTLAKDPTTIPWENVVWMDDLKIPDLSSQLGAARR